KRLWKAYRARLDQWIKDAEAKGYKGERYAANVAAWARNMKIPLAKPPAPAAPPGYSTHECGLSVDINRAPGDDPKTKEPDSPVDLWLRKHAASYGFVNDVKSEPWHWTYKPEKAKELLNALG